MSNDWGKLKYTNLMDFITAIKKEQYTNFYEQSRMPLVKNYMKK